MRPDKQIEEVLDFWFGKLTEGESCREDKSRLWWSSSHEMDHYIRNKFGKYIGFAIADHLPGWLETPRGTLAYIIVLDQFSRHVFRNSKKAYSQDSHALKSCMDGIEKRFDRELHPIERIFFYMPLMHSESMEMQKLSVEKFRELESEDVNDKGLNEMLTLSRDFAERHFDVIERFGRYPHRNKILKRNSTPEELEFLEDPRNTF